MFEGDIVISLWPEDMEDDIEVLSDMHDHPLDIYANDEYGYIFISRKVTQNGPRN